MTATELDRFTFDEEYWPPPTHPVRLAVALLLLLGGAVVAAVWFVGTAGLADGDAGAEQLTVPRVVGMNESLAATAITEAGFAVEVVRERNVVVPAGEVFRQTPDAGSIGDSDDVVRILVSGGSDYAVVPQLTGSLLDDVPDQLFWYVLSVGEVTYEQDMNTHAGEVLRQDPAPGTEVAYGTTIDLVVSEGPPPVDVPDVTGRPVEEAVRILTDAGFRVSTVQTYSTAPRGQVVSTTPRRGVEAPYGSTVKVYVSRGRAPVTTTVPPESTTPTTAPPTSTPPTSAPAGPPPGGPGPGGASPGGPDPGDR